MAENKQYEIDSFEKLINVMNPDNVQNLAADLAQWLLFCNHYYQQVRSAFPEETEGKTNWQIAKCSFNWIDDNKNDFLGFEMRDDFTGESTKKRF